MAFQPLWMKRKKPTNSLSFHFPETDKPQPQCIKATADDLYKTKQEKQTPELPQQAAISMNC